MRSPQTSNILPPLILTLVIVRIRRQHVVAEITLKLDLVVGCVWVARSVIRGSPIVLFVICWVSPRLLLDWLTCVVTGWLNPRRLRHVLEAARRVARNVLRLCCVLGADQVGLHLRQRFRLVPGTFDRLTSLRNWHICLIETDRRAPVCSLASTWPALRSVCPRRLLTIGLCCWIERALESLELLNLIVEVC